MKKSIGKRELVYPNPVFVIGTYDSNGIPNMMAASWGGICCSEPPCIAVSVRPTRYTYGNIKSTGAFTINIPSEKYASEADFVGIATGANLNKFEKTGLTPVKSELVNAPYIEEFPLNLICKVIKTIEIGVHVQFIGEILETLVDENVFNKDGYPDIDLIKPIIYDMPGRSYRGIGEYLLKAYSSKNKFD